MLSRVAATTILMLFVASLGYAQTTADGSIRGYVKDEQGGVLPGVALTATSPTVGSVRTAVSDAGGFYRLLDLPPGAYTITADLAGFARLVVDDVRVRAGLNLGVDLVMNLGSIEQTVEVKAETPMMEAQTATQATHIDGELQRSLPLTARKHWSDFLAMTPGVTFNQGTSGRADLPSLHGSSSHSTVTQVDGVDVASTVANHIWYINLPTEAIADVEVKTAAVDASAPLGVGAVLNIATKSGTDTFRGSVSVALQRKNWASNNNPGGTLASRNLFVPEAGVGGPILRGRLWFFSAYKHEQFRSGMARTPDQLAQLTALSPGFKPWDSTGDGDYLLAKVSSRLSARHQAEFSYSYDPLTISLGGATVAGNFSNNSTGGSLSTALRLMSAWGSALTSRLAVAYNNKTQKVNVVMDQPSRVVYRSVMSSGGRLIGNTSIATIDNGNNGQGTDEWASKLTVSGDVTYLKRGWAGDHELSGGFYLQPLYNARADTVYANGGFHLEDVVLRNAQDLAQGYVPFHRSVYDVSAFEGLDSALRNISFYAQDTWRPTERLTASAGVRVISIHRVDHKFDVVTQDHTDIGPRFGVNYAVTRDRKSIARASWVRVHDSATVSARAGSSTAAKNDLYDNNLDGIFETIFVTPAASAISQDRLYDSDLGQGHIDEWTVGFSRQLPGRVVADAAFVRRGYTGQVAQVEQNGIYENGVFKGYRNEALNEILLSTNNVWNTMVYSGLQFQVTKDIAQLRLAGSYTRSWRHLSGTWVPNDPASFIQPEAFANNKSIGDALSSDRNGLSGSSMTLSPEAWLDHAAQVGFVYTAPWNLLVSSSYVFQSGRYSGPIVTRIAAADPRFGPTTVPLSNGRVVSNPLATTVRFAYPTRGEGQLKSQSVHTLNLRLGYTIKVAAERRVEAAIEAFNLLNGDSDQGFLSGRNQLYSANYGKTGTRQPPRYFGLSLRFVF